ncbi:hypothetical protein [Streptomyces sp. XY006]|uniref:hypothetical protein n=1 Tax=Streptomyces sp. XY006 TaxID=2021410 RepID=UPI000B8C5C6A|nr:hypothetical protein [Streptomyces sp. XY006]OXS35256.1 hypothetical protein CHR28_12175 [Streptomyces sp. XY006]
MTTDKGRKKRRGPESSSRSGSNAAPRQADTPGPGRQHEHVIPVPQGLGSREACTRLLRLKKAETDNPIRRRRAHVDDVIRIIRNLAALVLFSAAVSALVAYAGIRMGVPPEMCWFGSVSGGPLLVRTFIKLFETVRPSLPDAPEDPPSTGGP